MTPARRAWAAGAAGIVLAATQPPLGFWPAFFIAGPALFLLWRADLAVGAFRVGWAAGFGFFAASLHWIVEPFLVDVAAHGWMAPIALPALAGGLALFWGVGFRAAAWAHRRLGAGGGLTAAATLTLGWAGAEFARSYVLTGFPWALPAYGWTDTPVAQSAALIGPYGLSLITLFAALALGPVFAPAGVAARAAPCLLAAGLLAGGWGWGAWRLAGAPAPDLGDAVGAPVIRILQTATPQEEKWLVERQAENFQSLMALSETPPAAEGAPSVILWPESAVTFAIDRTPQALEAIAARLGDADLALGSLRVAGEGASAAWRNSLFLIDGEGRLAAPFDKIHLVPFGEYLPLHDLFSALGLGALASSGIEPGEAPVVMTPAAAPPFAPLICYEMIFPRETVRAAAGARWMALVTNDAWFGEWAGPLQHFAKARMRAIETGLPIARSANKGVSAMIDPYGRPQSVYEPGVARVIDAVLPDSLEPTPYRRFGELFCAFAVCIIILLATLGRRVAHLN